MENFENTIVHAHDLFFRSSMTDLRIARDFFKAHLPEEILRIVDLRTLSIMPCSFIDHSLQESIADILYRTLIDSQEAYIYLLLEHKSRAEKEKLLPFHILKYLCDAIDYHLKSTEKETIPLIYPMVVYHGPSAYPYSNDIRDLVDAPRDLIDRYFLKPFQLIDLGGIEDEELKKHAWAGIMELIQKHIFARDILPHLEEIAELMYNIAQTGLTGRNFILSALKYILVKGELSDLRKFLQMVNKICLQEEGEKIMTLAEQLRREGKIEGKIEGKVENTIEIAERMLQEGVDIAFIAKITKLSLEKINELQKNLIEKV